MLRTNKYLSTLTRNLNRKKVNPIEFHQNFGDFSILKTTKLLFFTLSTPFALVFIFKYNWMNPLSNDFKFFLKKSILPITGVFSFSIGIFISFGLKRKNMIFPSKFPFLRSNRCIWIALYFLLLNFSMKLMESDTLKEFSFIPSTILIGLLMSTIYYSPSTYFPNSLIVNYFPFLGLISIVYFMYTCSIFMERRREIEFYSDFAIRVAQLDLENKYTNKFL